MNMKNASKLMAQTEDGRPNWLLEVLKAVLICVILWLVQDVLHARNVDANRLTALETSQADLKADVKEIKGDVKEIAKHLRK